jgi:multidrug resistance efflux pump
MFKHRPKQLTRINNMSRSKPNRGNTPDLAKVEKEEAEAAETKAALQIADENAAAALAVMEKEEAEAATARAAFEKAEKSKSIKTVTLLGGSRVTDPGTGVILIKNTAVIVPEISKWVKMQSKFIPPYLTFTE